ncbi:very-long-chain 3-oxoacyl-CoA reductase-B-like isoform X2 [Equus quagga]|uniref:very-long-chain 3-oxoacyl-CoA reductase-B-like isoform X2 n=1 Tax=Equus quagga TaxID=89248 RepID=UPI001EE251FC|nr:very-long-chain 3-oxoacyl-CoA reductase-B-like isoform X2 [Equus quagga]
MESEWDALRALGAVTALWLLLRVTWEVGHLVYVYLLPQARRGAPWLRAHGAWAVVTGATSGIGKAYAHELARRGLNIVLISRSLSKLDYEAKEIERLHGRITRVIQADFTGGLEIYGAIEAGLKDLEIGVLVNNVGMLYTPGFKKLLDCDNVAKRLSDVVNCNVMSVVQMTAIVLPQMVARGKGIIINISSLSDRRPCPFLAAYAASKTVSPYTVATNMTRDVSFGKNAEDFAREALDTLGLTSQTPGCLSHALQSFLLPLLPSWFSLSRWGVKLTSLWANRLKEKFAN